MKTSALDTMLGGLEARADALAFGPARGLDFGLYRDAPCDFVRDVLRGTSALSRATGAPYQFDALTLVVAHEQVAFRSGHGCGKTTFLAWLSLWWIATRQDALTAIVAPTHTRQARGIVGREVQKWANRGGLALRTDGTGMHLDGTGGRIVLLTAAADVGSLEGYHAPHTLLVGDEAKALPRDVLDALQGTMTGGEARQVLASTPGGPSGPFFDACRGDDWAQMHISAVDSSLVSERWLAGRAKAWGISSPTYRMRVLGEFPEDGSGQLIPWGLLLAATERNTEPPVPSRPDWKGCTMGVDVARSMLGDASACVVVRDGRVIHYETWREPDLTASCSRVLTLLARFGPERVIVDETGVGSGLLDRLVEHGRPAAGTHFGQRAKDAERFANARAEAFWEIRERLEAGALSLPRDDMLLEELAALRVGFDRAGRILLDGKDLLRQQLGRSPDLADALALACYDPSPAGVVWESVPDVLSLGCWTFQNEAALAQGGLLAAELGLIPEGDPLKWLPASMR